MVKVRLPDIRKNKLSTIIKSLEKRDAALQKFQRRDLFNAKSVKVVENTQIELYLPTLCGEKGKPTWNGSTHLDERKGAEGRAARNGGALGPGKEEKKVAEDVKARGQGKKFEKGAAGSNGRANLIGRKVPNKRPLLDNGLKTLRVNDPQNPFQVRSPDKKDGIGASKIEMVFKPTQQVVSGKQSERFSLTKTNMSLKSWNQNNPTENAYHWLSSGPGDLEQVQMIKAAAEVARTRERHLHDQQSTERFAVSMVKPSLPQVSTSPPHSHQLLEQLMRQRREDGEKPQAAARGSSLDELDSAAGGAFSRSQSESGSPIRIGAGLIEKNEGSQPNIVDGFLHHQRSYHHGEFSSFRDNSHIQGNISQHHARHGKGGGSFMEGSFIVQNVGKDGTVSILSSPSGSPPKQPQGSLGIRGSSPIKCRSPKKGQNGVGGEGKPSPSLSSPSLPPVDSGSSMRSGANAVAGPSPRPPTGVFMPYRSPGSHGNHGSVVAEDEQGGSPRALALDTSQQDLMDSMNWLSTKSAIASTRKKQQESLRKRYSVGGCDTSPTPPMRNKTPSPREIISSSRQREPAGHFVGQRTTRHGMIPERTSKAVLYPLHLSAKAPVFRERSIKGLSIAPSKSHAS